MDVYSNYTSEKKAGNHMPGSIIEAEQIAYLRGRYDQCRRLLTSPRMNKSQRELIEYEAYDVKEKNWSN